MLAELTPEFAVRMLLSVFYFLTGSIKLFSLSGFARVLQHYHVFPTTLCEFIAYLLPPLEITIGILLFTESYALTVITIVILLQLFLVYFTFEALREKGHVKNSGILGATFDVKLSWKIVMLNVLLLVGAGYLMFLTGL